jgi:hypothetical protein
MKTVAFFVGVAGISLLVASPSACAENQAVIVHEWGTFTSLQDEHGQAIGGINVDDEPVPGFVWQYANRMVAGQYSQDSGNFGLPPYNSDGGKGWTAGDPTVTMRLETPVIYVYPPKGQSPQSVPPLDVHVDFHGGVLSQYYPYALTDGADLNGKTPYLQKQGITESMSTGLTWKGVRLGSAVAPVETEDKVWTTPREVSAPILEVTDSDAWNSQTHKPGITTAEHFLFYRGVGHLDSPFEVASDGTGKKGAMQMGSPWRDGVGSLDAAWIVDIRADGSCASRTFTRESKNPLEGLNAFWTTGGMLWFPNFSSAFGEADFSANNLDKLKASMRSALVKAGLYPDEASAMLRTWDLSYFKSPGLRFFYMVPREWVDKVLPLKITGAPTQITRVMVGRIELITDEQRAALQRLSDGPCPDLPAFKLVAQKALQASNLPKAEVEAYYRGEKPLSDLGLTIPPLIRDYLSLGRFRDALMLHEFWQQKSMPLAQFINQNGMAPPGVEIKGRDLVPLPPDVSLKNPGRPTAQELHL